MQFILTFNCVDESMVLMKSRAITLKTIQSLPSTMDLIFHFAMIMKVTATTPKSVLTCKLAVENTCVIHDVVFKLCTQPKLLRLLV